jgi:excisionase family DNA binding protein
MNSHCNDTRLLSIAASARTLGVSEATIARWVKSSVIPHYRINGRTRINIEDLLNSARIEPESAEMR